MHRFECPGPAGSLEKSRPILFRSLPLLFPFLTLRGFMAAPCETFPTTCCLESESLRSKRTCSNTESLSNLSCPHTCGGFENTVAAVSTLRPDDVRRRWRERGSYARNERRDICYWMDGNVEIVDRLRTHAHRGKYVDKLQKRSRSRCKVSYPGKKGINDSSVTIGTIQRSVRVCWEN